MSLEGKVAVITGAASGIGKAIALKCCKEGMKVVLADIDEAKVTQLCNELLAHYPHVLPVKVDVSRIQDVENLAQQAVDKFGRVHLFFNNAGVGGSQFSSYQTSLTIWHHVLDTNLFGIIHGLKVFVPLMLKQSDECRIINTASQAGIRSGASTLLGPYTVSKHAVVALSEALHAELQGTKIKVHVLCPGPVSTDLFQNSMSSSQSESERGHLQAVHGVLKKVGMDPGQVAEILFEGFKKDLFYILTHPGSKELAWERAGDIVFDRTPVCSLPPVFAGKTTDEKQ